MSENNPVKIKIPPEIHNKKAMIERRERINGMLKQIKQDFPKAFFNVGFEKPLQIGIGKALAVHYEKQGTLQSHKILHDVLFIYTSRMSYLKTCEVGASRVDLFGEPAGEIDAKTHAYAVQRFDGIREKILDKHKQKRHEEKKTHQIKKQKEKTAVKENKFESKPASAQKLERLTQRWSKVTLKKKQPETI